MLRSWVPARFDAANQQAEARRIYGVPMNHPQSSRHEAPEPTLVMAWLPAVIGVIVICVESTGTMSAANTGKWLLTVCHWLWGRTTTPSLETANFILRKLGHFCGYGTLALLFRRGWYYTFLLKGPKSRLPVSASALAILCTFFVASLDEFHQSFLAGRSSRFQDVLLDTAGALVFHVILMVVIARRYRAAAEREVTLGV
jgi:VanZ family protein